MNLVLGICAAVAALVGLGLLWWRSRVGHEIALMGSLETSGAGSVAQLPPGTAVEVKGRCACACRSSPNSRSSPPPGTDPRLRARKPTTSGISQVRISARTRTTTVYQNMKYGQCLVEDQTGRVGIDFDGAEVEAVEVVNEPTADQSGPAGIVGGILNVVAGRNERYQRKEYILSPDISISMCWARCNKVD